MLKSLFAALLLARCGNTPPASVPGRLQTALLSGTVGGHATSAYDFTRPAVSYAVPPELQELSGQTLSGDQQLACIEDETGELFFYNLRTQRLDSTVQFGPKGDYEDVARIPGGYLILRSDGTLFKRTGRQTTTYATGLSAANEPEGLTYDAASQTLLVACKSEPGAGLANTKRAVYRLNPTTYRIEPRPAYVLDIEEILTRSPDAARQGKAAKKTGRLSQFAPAAVAVHPRTHHVFVLSARGNDLVELDAQGRLVAAQTLAPALFPHPEGLAFAPNGDLYVSSEAGSKKGPGRLYRFAETSSQP